MKRELTEHVYPEMKQYLTEDPLIAIAANLETTTDALRAALDAVMPTGDHVRGVTAAGDCCVGCALHDVPSETQGWTDR